MMSKRLAALIALVVLLVGGAAYMQRDDEGASGDAERGALLPGVEDQADEGASSVDDLALGESAPEASESREEAAPETVAKVVSAAAVEQEPEPTGPWLRGVVVGSDGLPVANAEVRVRAQGIAEGVLQVAAKALEEETTTDRNGEFRVPRGLILRGDANIEMRARGYLVTREVRAIEEITGDVQLGSLVMPRGVVIGGEVLNADGEPVVGASVRRTSREDAGALDGMLRMAATFGDGLESQTKTDEEGRFLLEYEKPGEYALVVEHDSYPKGRFEGVTPTAGGEDLAILLRLEPAATIGGRILGFPTGRSGVSVQLSLRSDDPEQGAAPATVFFENTLGGGHSARVAEDGTFLAEGLPVGQTYRLEATVKNGLFGRTPCSDSEVVMAGTQGVELTWDPGACVTFRLSDVETGEALRRGLVRYRWTGQREGVIPDAQKRHEFEQPEVALMELRPPGERGTLELAIVVDDYLEHRIANVDVPAGEDIDLGVIHLRRAPLVRVRVVDASSGKPLRRARVQLSPELGEKIEGFSLSGESARGKTDKEGYCELPACASETATLSVRKSGFAPQEIEGVFMPREVPSEETVRLYVGGRLSLRVVDTADLAVPSASIRHRDPDGSTTTRKADSEGRLELKGLTPGEHSFRATRQRGSRNVRIDFNADEDDQPWQTAVVTSGGDGEVLLEVPARATIGGVVTSRGEVVAGARVTLLRGEEDDGSDEMLAQLSEQMAAFSPDAPSSVRTDASGRYQLPDVPTGKHRLRVQRGDGSPAHLEPVEIARGENRADVSLPSSRVSGRIVDPRGDGIEGASVQVLRHNPEGEDREQLEQMRMAMSFFGGGASSGVKTDYDGSYVIEGVPHGVSLVVEARASGHVLTRSEPFELAENEDGKSNGVTLPLAGRLRVTIEGGGGPFQPVYARRRGATAGAPRSAMSMVQDGVATFRDLAPGTWEVSLSEDQDSEGVEVEVRAGEESLAAL